MVYKGICKKVFLVLAMTVAILLGAFGVSAESYEMILTAPEEVTLTLYEGFFKTSGRVACSASSVQTEEGITTYTYDVEPGLYNFTAKGDGYYTVHKNINFTAAKSGVVMDADPGKRTDNGYEPKTVHKYTDEVMDSATPFLELWKDSYPETFQTPYFTSQGKEGVSEHQVTTDTQTADFIAQLQSACSYMYTYSLGRSQEHGLDIPMVIFTSTDLSGATTWQQAAQLVQKNGKLTVHYQALVHGNEPAAGEAALAMIKKLAGAYGAGLLDKMNIYVIPVMSPDGTYDQSRMLDYNGNTIDPNRDMLRVQTKEAQLHHEIMLLFQPELFIDCHEFTSDITLTGVQTYHDMMIASNYTENNGEAYNALSRELAAVPFAQLEAQGLRPNYYSNYVNGKDPNTGRTYVSATGALSVLLESRGINLGTASYGRRCVAHVISATQLLDYTYQNTEKMQQVVDGERARIKADGGIYNDGEMIVLNVGKTAYQMLDITKFNLATGQPQAATLQTYAYTATRTRIAPTAYVIPAGESWTQDVLDLMDKHGITYRKLPANARIRLQQYTGSVDEAGLTDEMQVSFPDGAYVFEKNQSMGIVLSLLMEPDLDVAAGNAGTLAQSGMIPAENNVFPIYRYIRDLKNGQIEYTTEALEIPNEYVIYIDHAEGNNSNDGLTKDTPVKFVSTAYTKMKTLMENAPADAHATLVLINDINMADTTTVGSSHTFPVVIMGLTGTESINCNKNLFLNGPTTLQNLKLTYNGTNSGYALYARGNALTIGENVTNVVGTGGYRYSLVGANNALTASTNLTVRSGNWHAIYVGGYTYEVTGNASLVMTGGSAGRIAPSYNKPMGGNVTISLSNATVNEYIFCGPLNKENVAGNVSLTLGENVTAPVVWAGSRDAGNVTGDVTITLDGAQVGEIHGVAKNATGTVGSSTLVLKDDTAAQIADFDMVRLDSDVQNIDATGDLYINLNGHSVTGTVSAEMLYAMDSTTNGYSDDTCGHIANVSGKVAPSYTVGSGTGLKRYLGIKDENGGYSFHRIYVAVTGASITPKNTGLNYKTAFIADETVMNYINNTANVVFGLKAQIPGYESVYAVDADGFEAFEGTQDIKLYTERRTAVANVLKNTAPTSMEELTNAQRSELAVTAQAVVAIDNGDGTYTDLVLSSGASSTASFRQMAEKADAAWPSQSYAVKKALYDMYTAFKTDIDAAGWNVTNMKTEPAKA